MTKIKLVIIGPGIMPIPPTGWGAVESIIWDYKLFLDKYHGDRFETHIINTPRSYDIIYQTNALNPDIVHIQYDNHVTILQQINCKKIFLTSHYGYLDQMPNRIGDGYIGLINEFKKACLNNPNCKILALSPSIADTYKQYDCPENQLIVSHNGANNEIFRYNPECIRPDRSIYLAKVESRKRQSAYQDLPYIDFVGNCADIHFNTNRSNYLGEWSKPQLYENLTNYANLILLSDGDAHPLVTCEALVCGLGVVVSEFAAANLDRNLPFVDVIPTSKLNDLEYISDIVKKNQIISVSMRDKIREYGIDKFGWKNVVERYVETITA